MFDYFAVLISVILGLALIHLLRGLAKLIKMRHEITHYWVHTLPAAQVGPAAAPWTASQLTADIQQGTLPPVTFYKPHGTVNEHNGYANVTDGDQHIAALVSALQSGPQWRHMLIVITYDEFGGLWDHVPPPKADFFGPGTRIPAIIISPFAKQGYIDHMQYDTTSILRFITRRWDLPSSRSRRRVTNANPRAARVRPGVGAPKKNFGPLLGGVEASARPWRARPSQSQQPG